jgi:hypothetical protein
VNLATDKELTCQDIENYTLTRKKFGLSTKSSLKRFSFRSLPLENEKVWKYAKKPQHVCRKKRVKIFDDPSMKKERGNENGWVNRIFVHG